MECGISSVICFHKGHLPIVLERRQPVTRNPGRQPKPVAVQEEVKEHSKLWGMKTLGSNEKEGVEKVVKN